MAEVGSKWSSHHFAHGTGACGNEISGPIVEIAAWVLGSLYTLVAVHLGNPPSRRFLGDFSETDHGLVDSGHDCEDPHHDSPGRTACSCSEPDKSAPLVLWPRS